MALFLVAALSFLPGRAWADGTPTPTADERKVDAQARDQARADGHEVAKVLEADAKKEAGGDARREVEILKDRAKAAILVDPTDKTPTEGLSNRVTDTTRSTPVPQVDWTKSSSNTSSSSGYRGGSYYSPMMGYGMYGMGMGGYGMGMGGYGMGGYGMGGYGGYGGYGSYGSGYGSYGSYGTGSYGSGSTGTSTGTGTAHGDDHAYAMASDLAKRGSDVAKDAAANSTNPDEKAGFERDASDLNQIHDTANARLDELANRPPPPPPPAPTGIVMGGGGGSPRPSSPAATPMVSVSIPPESDKKPDAAVKAPASKPDKAAKTTDAAKPAASTVDKPATDDSEKVQTIAGRLVIIRKKIAPKAAAPGQTDEGLPVEAPSRKVAHARADVKHDEAPATIDAADVELPVALARIEQAIAGWRKEADDAKPAKDTFADTRGKDGRLDPARVEVWLVSRWRSPEPRRFRVRFDAETARAALGPDWVAGATVVARGEVSPIQLDDATRGTLQGEFSDLRFQQIVDDALPDADVPGR
jgi:hypothetical protein